ncbi:MAG: cysteine desulfurase family protein [Candidatus Shapirobacteria bacterium]|nr:cysteine desulfurase family protein [Candidatus Shapirobacteria bacterium]
MKKPIYFDYAATTPVDERVLSAMLPYFGDKFANSVSLHQPGQEAAKAVDSSRKTLARLLGAKKEEIIFTSSATESNNLALKGLTWANPNKKHLLVSSIEHDCVLNSAKWLSSQGYQVEEIPVDETGLVNPDQVAKMIRPDTLLVSVIYASNEVGTIEPIEEIGQVCREKEVLFHTDAAQTFGKLPIDVNKMNIDLLTASSHKIYGPKGAALLYLRSGIKITPLLHGGGHEQTRRSSTVNVPALVGFAKAAQIVYQEMESENKRLITLRDRTIKTVLEKIPKSRLNGHPQKRLSNNINLRFAGIEGEAILMKLDAKGIAVSTGSACASVGISGQLGGFADMAPSHVLLALGLTAEQAHGSIRVSLGRPTTNEEVDYFLKVLPQAVADLRRLSPLG